jgi:hypothetical protein
LAERITLNGYIDFLIPNCDEFGNGYEAYIRKQRGAVYCEACNSDSKKRGLNLPASGSFGRVLIYNFF